MFYEVKLQVNGLYDSKCQKLKLVIGLTIAPIDVLEV